MTTHPDLHFTAEQWTEAVATCKRMDDLSEKMNECEAALQDLDARIDSERAAVERLARKILDTFCPDASEAEREDAARRIASRRRKKGERVSPLFNTAYKRLKAAEADASGDDAAYYRRGRQDLLHRCEHLDGLLWERMDERWMRSVMQHVLNGHEEAEQEARRRARREALGLPVTPEAERSIEQEAKTVFAGKSRAEGDRTHVPDDVRAWAVEAYHELTNGETDTPMRNEAAKGQVVQIAAERDYAFTERTLARWIKARLTR